MCGLVGGVAHGVFDAPDGVLHLAGHLVGGAFGLQLGVAGDLAGRFFQAALGLRRGTFNAILDRSGVDTATRATAYRTSGWTGFDPAATPYTPDQVRRERELYR